MTFTESTPILHQSATAPRQGSAWLLVLAGFAVSAALCWPMAVRTWSTGDFLDTDDAMRMVQVRAWLAGQGWFDLTAWRLDPPAGSLMHWSRVVDVPIATLLKLFGLFAAPEPAERMARIAYPLLLQVALLRVMAGIGRLLMGPRGAICAVILTVLSGFMLGQFVPGRVDHHSMQILLLMCMIGSLLAALDPARANLAGVAALCLALSLSISLENLPFMLVAVAVLPVAWAWDGVRQAPALRSFGIGLLLALPVCFGLFHAGADRFQAACDAYSVAHLLPGLAGALACLGLSLSGKLAHSRPRRIGWLVAAGLAVAAPVLASGGCLGDPFTGLDPLVRELWLGNTTEARPLRQVLTVHPSAWAMLTLPTIAGVMGIAAAIGLTDGTARLRWLSLLPLTLSGALAAVWMIRAETSLAPVALLGGVFVCAEVWLRLGWRYRRFGAAVALALTLPFSTIGWSLMAPVDDNPAEHTRLERAAACRVASAYAPLAALPAGLVFAPMDAGAHLLAHTDNSVLGAPYHRNNHGNRLVLDALLAPASAAEGLVRGSGARYFMACPGEVQLEVTKARAPEGFAADLLAGRVPSWLVPVETAPTPFQVYRLR